MDDLIRRIDAIKAINTLYYPDGEDLVKVVRCHECKYSTTDGTYNSIEQMGTHLNCRMWLTANRHSPAIVKKEGYCAWGKSREDTMTIGEAIEQIKWYFEEDDGIGAEPITKEAVSIVITTLEKLSAEIES